MIRNDSSDNLDYARIRQRRVSSLLFWLQGSKHNEAHIDRNSCLIEPQRENFGPPFLMREGPTVTSDSLSQGPDLAKFNPNCHMN